VRRALAALMLWGCAMSAGVSDRVPDVDPVIPVWIDERFSDAQRQEFSDAIRAWNKALGGYRRFFIASGRADFTHGLTYPGITVELALEHRSPSLATTNKIRGQRIRFFPKTWAKHPECKHSVVLAHELGHTMGLDDDVPDSGLMRGPYGPHENCIDNGTLRRVALVNGWDQAKMTPVCL
jgi:hypothetical protein